ncbi:hypothetical protein SAMN05444274_106294 [Mariniphaga anaerophila]|uniref:Uncharacterized protein n=1 Tax=Mariniphaga anaerophila TaxID=1484053 RepID=A0A1M5CW53_9BACT|nr:hypothetical protein [Mariniphaga anaerophila]SHF59010.1 hypothetical protein SAMN05444274_106294 [Mariniphaga anaerophila]
MKPEKEQNLEKKEEVVQSKKEGWIDKAEKIIDETSEKIHNSDAYRKADQSMEKATKKIFRQAGKWWGKSERYFKNLAENEENTK